MRQRIEPDLQYCLQCGDEYRAEIQVCATCEVDLVAGAQLINLREKGSENQQKRSMEIEPGEALVSIRQGPVLQIKQLQAYLKEQSLPSVLISEAGANCGKGCCGTDVTLQVREADLQSVMTVLEREYLQSTGLMEHDTTFAGEVYDVSAAETTCPACGHIFATGSGECPDCGLCFA